MRLRISHSEPNIFETKFKRQSRQKPTGKAQTTDNKPIKEETTEASELPDIPQTHLFTSGTGEHVSMVKESTGKGPTSWLTKKSLKRSLSPMQDYSYRYPKVRQSDTLTVSAVTLKILGQMVMPLENPNDFLPDSSVQPLPLRFSISKMLKKQVDSSSSSCSSFSKSWLS